MEINLYTALAAAQGAMPQPNKDREVTVAMRKADGSPGGNYKFKYATLENCISTVRPHLAANGLGFVQFIAPGEMVTRIFHSSGEFLDCAIPMPNLPNKPQEAGSLISYFKRYSLCTALGITADEDDDANIAQGNDYTATAPRAKFPDGVHKTKTALDTAITAFCTHIAALTTSDDLEAYVTEQHPTLAQYRAAYGRDSDHVAAITQQIANARTRVAARAELPADEGPVAGREPFEWPESVQRLVSQIGTRETTKALETWVALPATKAIMATLDPVELQYVRGAYSDRAKAINAMEVSGA